MPTCFVIQPFDGGAFDKRFEEVVAPAIAAAGLEPYRVDRDPAASIPIDQIETGIRNAQVCLADITLDNPNVWFELGFAIATTKEVVLVCAQTRQRFPFDIQHRHVITYQTDSSGDFDVLKEKITGRLKSILSKVARLGTAASVTSPLAPVHGLAAHELVTLVSVAQNLDNPSGTVSTYIIRQDMERTGFTKIAVTLGLKSLLTKGLISGDEEYDDQTERSYPVYRLTDEGFEWLLSNQEKLALTIPPKDEPPF